VIHNIYCSSCSEPAVSFDSSEATTDTFDQKIFPCAACGFLGRVDVDYENNQVSATFTVFDEDDIAVNVEYSQLLEAYMFLQKKNEELLDEYTAYVAQVRECY
jgi:hypothetical protein